MIPIGDIFDLAHKREYQSIPKGIIKGYHTYLNVFKRGCGGKENQWGPVAVSVKEANPRMVVCAMLHHKVGWCTYTRDVTSKKNMDRIFINPRTTRVPIIKVIKYQHGAASDSVSFINNHLQSTKKLSVGSIQEIIQGRCPESLNLQILGASKHQTEENKYRLKMTDGRDLIDEAVLDSSEMSPPNKFSIIQISDRDTPANVTKHQVKPIGEKYALVINHFTLLKDGHDIGYQLHVPKYYTP